jgi:hypothetical protein
MSQNLEALTYQTLWAGPIGLYWESFTFMLMGAQKNLKILNLNVLLTVHRSVSVQ